MSPRAAAAQLKMASLRRAAERDDRQVPAAAVMSHFQFQLRAGPAANQAQGLAQGEPRGHRARGS